MNTVALNNLWSYLEGLSLSANNKRWLSERLLNSAALPRKTEKERELEALRGVWNNEDGEKIAQAIRTARENNYVRHVETIE